MPKKVRRNKRGSTAVRTRAGPAAAHGHSVKELLARSSAALTRVTDQAERANRWNSWLAEHLPPELRGRVSGVVERSGTLVIFAESAAWAARMRYAVLGLEAAIRAARPGILAAAVRVLPRR
ncbi:MAG TPA: DciA family protein [Steroidobacteraceae bacterium]|nr:DciA family protein [Steroidobacteraceae bacterium]